MEIESTSPARQQIDVIDRANTIIHQMLGIAGLLRSAAYSNDNPEDAEIGASADLMADMLTELRGHVSHLAKEH